MLELRFRELDPVVDAFVIVESNYTHFGKPKPLHYRANKLGLRLSPFAHKVVYVPMGMARELLTKSGCEIGWIHNINMVKEIGRGLKGLPFTPRDDDIVVVGDADEIPSRHAVQQLKSSWGSGCDVYRLKMRWSFYGFFWHNRGRHSQTSTARRFGQDQRRRASNGHLAEKACDMPQGGWHCSWCFHDSDYRTKLTAALCGDGVRFGDFHWPDRTIKILRSRGIWFGADSIPPYTPAKINDGDAPLWALENPERFRYLLQPPADPEHRSARPVMPYCPCDAPVRNLPGGGRMECDPAMDSIVGRYNSADRSYLQRLRSVWCH